jgi:alpha-D-ribose 1-methylphosphonate 5-triphosphate synthase subunit PhnH
MPDLATDVIYRGGFTNPVFGSQAVFRHLMDAMASPGSILDLGDTILPPAPLTPAAGAILAALADYDTPVWFEAKEVSDAAAWLAFHAGARRADSSGDAIFAVLNQGSPTHGWSNFAVGTASYPDRSATLLLPVADLRNGPVFELKGPGIETVTHMAPLGLPDGFAAVMADNRARFPLGFDLLLVCGSEVLALPRTTRITEI